MNRFPWRLVFVVLLSAQIWAWLRLLRPLQRLASGAQRLAEGDFDSLVEPVPGAPEIEALRRSLVAMAGHVRRAQEQGRGYASALTAGQESERRRIAQELHDDTIQAMIAVGQRIDLARSAAGNDPAAVGHLLEDARQQITEAVSALRAVIADLRPPALEELGLIPALQMLVESPDGPRVTLDVQGVSRRLDEAVELALFRVAQEALSNGRRHGAARHVTIRIEYRSGEMALSIQDDGSGFVVPHPLSALADAGHYGLIGMWERARHLGGELVVRSAPGAGTSVEIRLPTPSLTGPDGAVYDPVCRALISPDQAYGSVSYRGETYYFCCPVCRGAFLRDPQAYLSR